MSNVLFISLDSNRSVGEWVPPFWHEIERGNRVGSKIKDEERTTTSERRMANDETRKSAQL